MLFTSIENRRDEAWYKLTSEQQDAVLRNLEGRSYPCFGDRYTRMLSSYLKANYEDQYKIVEAIENYSRSKCVNNDEPDILDTLVNCIIDVAKLIKRKIG